MPRGRPKKQPVAYDEEAVKEFIQRLFTIESEVLTLKEDKKQLKEEFKDKVDAALMAKVIRLVKLKLEIKEKDMSDDTLEDVEGIVLEKINMVV